jgi:hypothetical protein
MIMPLGFRSIKLIVSPQHGKRSPKKIRQARIRSLSLNLIGFWTSFLGRQSHHLWQWLRPVFQTRGLQRHQLAAQLKDVRTLRNRVAHYEPILALPLAQRYAEVTTLTGWLSSAAAAWINRHSSWQSIYPAVPILTTDPTTKITRMDPAVLPYLPPV